MKKVDGWAVASIFIVSTIIFILGILFGKLIKEWPLVEFKKEVDLGQTGISFLSILITIFAAYWVSKVLANANEETRVEKDLILKKLDGIYNLIENFADKVNSAQIAYTEAAADIKRIHTSSKSIFSIIDATSIKLEPGTQGEIKDCLSELRDLLTNTPRADEIGSKADSKIKVKSGILSISKEGVLVCDKEFDKLKDIISRLQIKINKA